MSTEFPDPVLTAARAVISDPRKKHYADRVLAAAFAVRDAEGPLLLRRDELEQVGEWRDHPVSYAQGKGVCGDGAPGWYPVFRLRQREGEGET